MKVETCPFCGDEVGLGGAMEPESFAKTQTEFAVECRSCQAFGPFRATMEEAVEAWNRRVPHERP